MSQTPDKEIRPKKTRPKKIKPFRLAGKNLFLTYPQVSPSVSREDVLAHLQWQHYKRPFKYLIALEKHKDGGTHFHVIIFFDKIVNIKNPHTLDLKVGSKAWHGHYQVVSNLPAAVSYCKKSDADFITDYSPPKKPSAKSAKPDAWSEIVSLALSDRVPEALSLLYTRHPKEALVTSAVDRIRSLSMLSPRTKSLYELSNFRVPSQVSDWVLNQSKLKTLWVWGDSELGKTELMITILNQSFGPCLRAQTLDDLKLLNNGLYGSLMLDDMDDALAGLPRSSLISLFDVRRRSSIKARYSDARIPADLPRAILSNYDVFVILGPLGEDHAIQRRMVSVEVEEDLRKIEIQDRMEQPEIAPAALKDKQLLRILENAGITDLNGCTEEDLLAIPGIGPKRLQLIKALHKKA